MNCRGRSSGGAVQVGRTQPIFIFIMSDAIPTIEKREKKTNLAESGGLSVRPSICVGILVVVETVAVASNDDNTEDLRQQHCLWKWVVEE